MKTKNKTCGFTLIELLIAMTIVAILTGMGLVSFMGAKKSGRDSKRKAELEQIRSALEMCRADTGAYASSIYDNITCGGNTYLAGTPRDPLDNTSYYYYYYSATDKYTLCAALEIGGSPTACPAPATCGSSSCNYKVTNP